MRCRVCAIVVLVACYAPTHPAGSPCSATSPCPDGLVCAAASQTCELHDTDAAVAVGCVPTTEICGDGIDQDCDGSDLLCPSPNDRASGAIEISNGTSFTADLAGDHDDASGGGDQCGQTGGLDVFYTLHLSAPEAIYLDTFGSDFDTVVRVYAGACIDGGQPASTCSDDACGTTQTQDVWDLAAGAYCVVVDQRVLDRQHTHMTLHLEHGGRTGLPITLGTSVTGSTVGKADQSTPPCKNVVGPDVGYHLPVCPGTTTFTASTCNAIGDFDDAVYVREGTTSLACDDDDQTCNASSGLATVKSVTATGPHLVWIIVDGGGNNTSGAYRLDTTIQ